MFSFCQNSHKPLEFAYNFDFFHMHKQFKVLLMQIKYGKFALLHVLL